MDRNRWSDQGQKTEGPALIPCREGLQDATQDFAISRGLKTVEAGAQGEHKFQRGFSALPVYSSHKLFHPQGAAAIASFLTRERRATIRALNAYRKASPNKDEPEYLPEFAGE